MKRAAVASSCAVAFALGVLGSRIISNIPYFEMDRKVDVVELVAFIATFSATILASFILYRKLERLRHSDQLLKEALFGRLKGCMLKLDHVEECFRDNPLYVDVARSCRVVRREFESYNRYAAAVGTQHGVIEVTQYQLLCSELKDLLTNTPRNDEKDPQLWVENDRICYKPDRAVEIEKKLDEAREVLYTFERAVLQA